MSHDLIFGMSYDTLVGVFAGLGWGTFLGFLIGAAWLRSFILEIHGDDGPGKG